MPLPLELLVCQRVLASWRAKEAYSAFEKGFQRRVHEALACLQRIQDVRLRSATRVNVRTGSQVAELVNKPCLCGSFLNDGVQSDFSFSWSIVSGWLWLRLGLSFRFSLRGGLSSIIPKSGAPKIAKLTYKWLNYGIWWIKL